MPTYIHTHLTVDGNDPNVIMYVCIHTHTYICMCRYTHTHMYLDTTPRYLVSNDMSLDNTIRIIIEGRFHFFQRFSSSKLVLKTVESCFVALNYYENGSAALTHAPFGV